MKRDSGSPFYSVFASAVTGVVFQGLLDQEDAAPSCDWKLDGEAALAAAVAYAQCLAREYLTANRDTSMSLFTASGRWCKEDARVTPAQWKGLVGLLQRVGMANEDGTLTPVGREHLRLDTYDSRVKANKERAKPKEKNLFPPGDLKV